MAHDQSQQIRWAAAVIKAWRSSYRSLKAEMDKTSRLVANKDDIIQGLDDRVRGEAQQLTDQVTGAGIVAEAQREHVVALRHKAKTALDDVRTISNELAEAEVFHINTLITKQAHFEAALRNKGSAYKRQIDRLLYQGKQQKHCSAVMKVIIASVLYEASAHGALQLHVATQGINATLDRHQVERTELQKLHKAKVTRLLWRGPRPCKAVTAWQLVLTVAKQLADEHEVIAAELRSKLEHREQGLTLDQSRKHAQTKSEEIKALTKSDIRARERSLRLRGPDEGPAGDDGSDKSFDICTNLGARSRGSRQFGAGQNAIGHGGGLLVEHQESA